MPPQHTVVNLKHSALSLQLILGCQDTAWRAQPAGGESTAFRPTRSGCWPPTAAVLLPAQLGQGASTLSNCALQ